MFFACSQPRFLSYPNLLNESLYRVIHVPPSQSRVPPFPIPHSPFPIPLYSLEVHSPHEISPIKHNFSLEYGDRVILLLAYSLYIDR